MVCGSYKVSLLERFESLSERARKPSKKDSVNLRLRT